MKKIMNCSSALVGIVALFSSFTASAMDFIGESCEGEGYTVQVISGFAGFTATLKSPASSEDPIEFNVPVCQKTEGLLRTYTSKIGRAFSLAIHLESFVPTKIHPADATFEHEGKEIRVQLMCESSF